LIRKNLLEQGLLDLEGWRGGGWLGILGYLAGLRLLSAAVVGRMKIKIIFENLGLWSRGFR
jgi:hypothetical protein